ncbi:hypothetical protein BYT27DRAFT_7182065 [Phlegmacium glaucopus]|nr:hypothetical protein BYT27DRAFT_7182065 [Phlegmacium glaucopus]
MHFRTFCFHLQDFELEDQEKLLEPLQFLPPTKAREPNATIRLAYGFDYQRQHGVYERLMNVKKMSNLQGEEWNLLNADEEIEENTEVDT